MKDLATTLRAVHDRYGEEGQAPEHKAAIMRAIVRMEELEKALEPLAELQIVTRPSDLYCIMSSEIMTARAALNKEQER